MSSKERLADVMERILDRLDAIEERLELVATLSSIEQVRIVAVETNREVGELQTRLIEKDSRDGETFKRHQKAIQETDARTAKLERRTTDIEKKTATHDAKLSELLKAAASEAPA